MPVSLNKNTLIRTDKCRFLIMDAPTDKNLERYISQMKENNVTALVRACEPSYDKSPVEKAGIQVEDMFFADGSSPSDDVMTRWLDLTSALFHVRDKTARPSASASRRRFRFGRRRGGGKKARKGSGGSSSGGDDNEAEERPPGMEPVFQAVPDAPPECVAVHCVAGLGRAPVLVALALIELERLDPFSAIEQIRGKRRGAFNSAQLDFLEKYKRRRGRKLLTCVVM